MKTLQVYDPALCCSSGVCGVDVDQTLVDFAADLNWLKQQGVAVTRFNLAQQPLAFAQEAAVKAALDAGGAEALPVLLVDCLPALPTSVHIGSDTTRPTIDTPPVT